MCVHRAFVVHACEINVKGIIIAKSQLATLVLEVHLSNTSVYNVMCVMLLR